MDYRIIVFLLSSSVLFSCKQKNTAAEVAGSDSTVRKEYFPVYDFLKSQIREVDSLPGGIRIYTSSGNHTDSGYITTAQFDELAAQFTSEQIKEPAFTTGFNETNFYDRSSKTSTFMYQSTDTANPVKRVDILTKARDTYDKVSSIYMEKQQPFTDSTVIRKMIWKTGSFFQVTQLINYPSRPAVERQVKVVWNNWEPTP